MSTPRLDAPAVRYLLVERRWRQRHLATRLEVGEGALCHYLAGRRTIPEGLIERMAAALDVAPSAITLPAPPAAAEGEVQR